MIKSQSVKLSGHVGHMIKKPVQNFGRNFTGKNLPEDIVTAGRRILNLIIYRMGG